MNSVPQAGPVIPEQRRKGLISVDTSGNLVIYHSTAGRLVLDVRHIK